MTKAKKPPMPGNHTVTNMAELTLTYGTMAAGKSTLALQLCWQLRSTRGDVALWTFGDRSGTGEVTSRIGISSPATAITPGTPLDEHRRHLLTNNVGVLVVDEAQFATEKQIDELALLVDEDHIDVHTFGLGADFRLSPFPGTARLFAIADSVKELPLAAYCWCGAKGRCNGRIVDGKLVRHGPQQLIGDTAANQADPAGGKVTYSVLCRRHYRLGQHSPVN